MQPHLILTFSGDGPYWSDFLHLPAFPSGFSYRWAFRYSESLVAGSLVRQMASQGYLDALCGKEVVMGARFIHSDTNPLFRHTLVPIRTATITKARLSFGIYQFLFRVGPMFDFSRVESLKRMSVEIPEDVQDDLDGKLAFEMPQDLRLPDLSRGDEGLQWHRFVKLLVNEEVLPIRKDARQAMFMRFETPQYNGEPVSVARIQKTHRHGDVYGAVLMEGKTYEVPFAHYIPFLQDKETSLGEIPLTFDYENQNIELTSPQVRVLGNYEDSAFTISALLPSAAWEKLILRPESEELKSQDGDYLISVSSLEIPVKVEWSFVHRLFTRWLWILLLWVAFSLKGLADFLEKLILKKGEDFDQFVSDPINWLSIGFIVFGSAAAAWAVTAVQARLGKK